jgi:hypothetical protein
VSTEADDIIEVWEKFPSPIAFVYPLDQAIDKPKASVDVQRELQQHRTWEDIIMESRKNEKPGA